MKVVVAIVLVLAACGDNLPGVSVREYGTAQRNATCRRLVRCGVMPDIDTCERTNLGPVWESSHWFDAVDQGLILWHPALAHACIEEQANRSCELMRSPAPDSYACSYMYEGTLGDGEPCTFGSQCIGGECWSTDRDNACWVGSCVGTQPPAPVGLGETCGYAPCLEGYCNDINLCVPYGVEGESCDVDTWCDRGFDCVANRCQRLPDTGEACSSWCRQISDVCGSDYTCGPAAQLGEACKWDIDCGHYGRCASGTCITANAPMGGACTGSWDCADLTAICWFRQEVGTCIPPRDNGESCWEAGDCASKFCDGTFHCAAPESCPSPSDL